MELDGKGHNRYDLISPFAKCATTSPLESVVEMLPTAPPNVKRKTGIVTKRIAKEK
jgi:hypothetical protein